MKSLSHHVAKVWANNGSGGTAAVIKKETRALYLCIYVCLCLATFVVGAGASSSALRTQASTSATICDGAEGGGTPGEVSDDAW